MFDLEELMGLSEDELEERLKQMTHSDLYMLRSKFNGNQQMQNRISPFEHGAFAREATQENPLMALPIAAGTLAYQPYKALMGSRSQPSLQQVLQGLQGVGQGLKNRFF
jgi:hypothetical protein